MNRLRAWLRRYGGIRWEPDNQLMGAELQGWFALGPLGGAGYLWYPHRCRINCRLWWGCFTASYASIMWRGRRVWSTAGIHHWKLS